MDIVRDLTELGELLTAASPQLRSVVSDAAKLNTPGAWLRLDFTRWELLNGSYTLGVTVHLAVADKGVERAHGELSELFSSLRQALEQVGYTGADITFTGLLIPGSSSPLPALAVPLELHITEGD